MEDEKHLVTTVSSCISRGGGGETKDGSHSSHGDLWYLIKHICKEEGEMNMYMI